MHTRLAHVALALALVGGAAVVLTGGIGGATDGGPGTAATTVDTINGSAISLASANGSNGQYASYDADGELQLHLEELNDDAETTAHEVFEIEVTAAEPAALSVESDVPGVSFYWSDDPTADATTSRTVRPGESIAAGVRADSYGDEVEDGNLTVVAEPTSPGGGGAVPYPPPGSGGDGLSVISADVSPTEIAAGESVTATATVSNAGSSAASGRIDLEIDGTVVDQRTVTVPAGTTERVSFERTFQQTGEHAVSVGDLEAGTVTVVPDSGADGFAVSNATLSPSAIQPGGTTTITANVTNHGDAADVFTAELSVGGVVVEDQVVAVDAGATEQVTFERQFDQRGGYEIAVSGAEAGTLRVESSTASAVRRYGSEYGWLLGAATVPTLGGAFVAARRRRQQVSAGS